MTEEEAKRRWCPMSRVSVWDIEPAYNRGKNGPPSESRCIASDCMMWVRDNPWDAEIEIGHCGLGDKP